jgi:hypothetical protein
MVETNPLGLSYETAYARQVGFPADRGISHVFVTLDSPNHRGKTSEIFRLGHFFESWLREKAVANQVSEAH